MRHPQALVHLDCQRQRIRTQLHGRGSQRIRGLARISLLHPPVALAAVADGNIKTPPDRLAHHLLLKLRFDLLLFYRTPAAAVCRQRDCDHFIHLLGNGFTVTPAVGGTGLALAIALPPSAGKRRRLPFVAPLSFFQLALQLLVLLAQPFLLLTQPVLLLPPLFLQLAPVASCTFRKPPVSA
jgi:hypothetical protein